MDSGVGVVAVDEIWDVAGAIGVPIFVYTFVDYTVVVIVLEVATYFGADTLIAGSGEDNDERRDQ